MGDWITATVVVVLIAAEGLALGFLTDFFLRRIRTPRAGGHEE